MSKSAASIIRKTHQLVFENKKTATLNAFNGFKASYILILETLKHEF